MRSQSGFSTYRLAAAALAGLTLLAATAQAQTCAAPLPLPASGNSFYNGTTCGSAGSTLAAANLGLMPLPGSEDIYRLATRILPTSISITLTPAAGLDLALLVCRSPCGGSSACVAMSDAAFGGGTESVTFIGGDVPYYVIVDSLEQSCGGYTLSVTAPLDD